MVVAHGGRPAESVDIWSQLETSKERRRRLAFEKDCIGAAQVVCVSENVKSTSSDARRLTVEAASVGTPTVTRPPLSYAAVTKMAAKQDKDGASQDQQGTVSKKKSSASVSGKIPTVNSGVETRKAGGSKDHTESAVVAANVHHGVWMQKSAYSAAESEFYSSKHRPTRVNVAERVSADVAQWTSISNGVWLDKPTYDDAERRYYEAKARTHASAAPAPVLAAKTKRSAKQSRSAKHSRSAKQSGKRAVGPATAAVQFELDDMYYEEAILPERQSSVTMAAIPGFTASALCETLLPDERLDSLITEPDMDMGEMESGNFVHL